MKLYEIAGCFLLAGAACISACSKSDNSSGLTPKMAKPAWGTDIHNEMQVVIEKLESYNNPPLYTLSTQEARTKPSFADALRDVMTEHKIAAPTIMSDTAGITIPVDSGNTITARVYTPKSINGNLPVILYFHGGGWVIADANTYDASTRALCDQTGAIVVSVNYRRGPEYKFPTAHNDCYAAYKWLRANAASIKGDSSRIAVAGESAGGNLACNVSIMARDSGITMPVAQVLIYPVASNYTNSDSYMKYDSAMPLNKPLIYWFLNNFLPDDSYTADTRISLVNAKLSGLPPTTIINAEIDPLQDDGATLQARLQSAGVTVNRMLYMGVTHEFFGMGAVVPEAKQAEAYAAAQLRAILSL